ncbi:MAG TPA: hypothetical protein VFF68_04905, partial [Anaerolineaceae bacterium]|nr:hypothetical protein [Anaerolineaceae bacterium]
AWLLLPMMMPLIAATIFVPLALITWAPRLIAVVQTLQGKNFRYPWLAGQVERFEGNEKRRP